MLIESLKHNYVTKQLAFPQAPISKKQFVELPKGLEIEGASNATHVFEVLRNIYGGKDAGRQWFLHLKRSFWKLVLNSPSLTNVYFIVARMFILLWQRGLHSLHR